MQTRRIRVNDIEVTCTDTGPEAGRPFVLIHGFTGHRDDFLARLPDLAGDRRVLAPDLRGHGDATHTGRAEQFTFAQLVDDLRALLDALEIDRCDLLGHSLGGMVTLRFVLAHPDRVASLVLMDTTPFAPAEYGRAVFEKAGGIAMAKGMVWLQARLEQASRANPSDRPSDRQIEKWSDFYWEHQRRRYGAMDPVAYGALGIEMVEQTPVLDRLGEIRCPTTVLVGADDEGFLDGADALEAGIPGVHRITVPDSGHHPQMENPTVWLDTVKGHLAKVGGAAS